MEGHKEAHLLAGEELSLVLIDDRVPCGHSAVLIPGDRTQEVSWVGQTVRPCTHKTDSALHCDAASVATTTLTYDVVFGRVSVLASLCDTRDVL